MKDGIQGGAWVRGDLLLEARGGKNCREFGTKEVLDGYCISVLGRVGSSILKIKVSSDFRKLATECR